MYKFICLKCGKPQYSASREKIREPCIYCKHDKLIEEVRNESERAQRKKIKWHFTYASPGHTGE